MRQCGSCTLCCRLVPVADLHKAAGQRCVHQRSLKGCAIYAKRPLVCRLWNCRWLVGDDTADMSRPDRSHYVIDTMVDYVKMRDDDGVRPDINIPVLQIWCDPKYPEAWRDPALLAFIERRGSDGFGALIRYGPDTGRAVFPPSLTREGWHERDLGQTREEEHGQADIARVLSEATGDLYAVMPGGGYGR